MSESLRAGPKISQMQRIAGGGDAPCFIIAEIGVNHNGRRMLARNLVDAAIVAGADAVKFQTFKADRLVAVCNRPKRDLKCRGDKEKNLESTFEILKNLELSRENHRYLSDYCRKKNILFFSTPFDENSADFLEELDVPVFKIASGELTHLRFLAHVARIGKPMIVSTGMATLAEVEKAVQTIYDTGNRRLILLHCVSSYPAKPEEANLRVIQTLTRKFDLPVGFSDHTPGIEVSLAAVALGARVIEKHFTLDTTLPGPDHRLSLEPQELAALVTSIRNIEAAMGHGQKVPTAGELETARAARRSLVAARLIKAGTPITERLIVFKRPGTGLPPEKLDEIIGQEAKTDIPKGSLLTEEMLT